MSAFLFVQACFIVGKALGIGPIAQWGWPAVFSPMLIPLALMVASAVVFIAGSALAFVIDKR
jgi:ABC-type antimicrobial peptide transport system permease subunit